MLPASFTTRVSPLSWFLNLVIVAETNAWRFMSNNNRSPTEDPHTPVLRRLVREKRQPERYTPPNFCSNFDLSITNDDPRTIREVVD